MAKTKLQKKELVALYKEDLNKFDTFFIVKPINVTPNEATAIKKNLDKIGSSYNLVKNSLFEVALKETGIKIDSLGKGQRAIIFSSEKIGETTKIISDNIKNKDIDKLEIIGGVLNGEIVTANQVIKIANLPNKEVLLSQLLNVMNGPIRNFVYVLNGNMQELVYVLNAIKNQKA